MSSNKTTNLGLHSWERTDAFQMEEFNENFDKIDEAVGENKTALAEKADKEEVSAALTEKVEIKCGTYTGNGQETRKIDLGFTPKAVYVCDYRGCTTFSSNGMSYYGGLALPGHPINDNGRYNALSITEGGFMVYFAQGAGMFTNLSQWTFHYIAFK